MSIWSSIGIGGPDVLAVDIDASDADPYRCTGPKAVSIDIATAVSWNGCVRLALDTDDDHLHACLALEPQAARLLRDRIDEALQRIESGMSVVVRHDPRDPSKPFPFAEPLPVGLRVYVQDIDKTLTWDGQVWQEETEGATT